MAYPAEVAEFDAVQAAIDVFMADNDLAEVTPSTSDAGGEKLRGTGSQFHDTFILRDYLRDESTKFCYRWQSNGKVIFQYDANGDGNCAIDADQLFP